MQAALGCLFALFAKNPTTPNRVVKIRMPLTRPPYILAVILTQDIASNKPKELNVKSLIQTNS
jgi:hypothetical protein